MDERVQALAAIIELHGIPAMSLTIFHEDAAGGPSIVDLVVEGAAASATLERLRELADRTGQWPVLIGGANSAADMQQYLAWLSHPVIARDLLYSGLTPVQVILAAGRALDPVAVLQQLVEERVAAGRPPPRHDWEVPGDDDSPIASGALADRDGASLAVAATDGAGTAVPDPAPCHICLVATPVPWEAPAYFRFGGWNWCPPPPEQVAILKHWHEQYGAEVVALAPGTIDLRPQRRPRDLAEALALAWEHLAYCDDIEPATIEALAKSLMMSDNWHFWWD
jgi:hypothetical protein